MIYKFKFRYSSLKYTRQFIYIWQIFQNVTCLFTLLLVFPDEWRFYICMFMYTFHLKIMQICFFLIFASCISPFFLIALVNIFIIRVPINRRCNTGYPCLTIIDNALLCFTTMYIDFVELISSSLRNFFFKNEQISNFYLVISQ